MGDYNSIALDSAGNPHISYWELPNKALDYAEWTGSAWIISNYVDGSPFKNHVGYYNSIAIDPSNDPHISYYDATNGDLKYAQWTGSTWNIETVDSTGDAGLYTSIELDKSGKPHISYYDATNGDLKYAKWTGSTWNIETVDSTGNTGLFTSLSLDSSGNPRISYYDSTNGEIKYARKECGIWNIQTVDSTGVFVGIFDTSLAIDPSGDPHISYFDSASGDLKYATAKTLPPSCGTDVPEYPSIALPVLSIAGLLFIFGRKKRPIMGW
jgi:hypothetical protein